MKLTLKQTYEFCEELYRWLEKNPYRHQGNWPEWKENGGEYRANHNCFACEYVDQEIGRRDFTCGICPLIDLWPDGCLSPHSPYAISRSTNNTENKRVCYKQIADFCQEKLKALNLKKEEKNERDKT